MRAPGFPASLSSSERMLGPGDGPACGYRRRRAAVLDIGVALVLVTTGGRLRPS